MVVVLSSSALLGRFAVSAQIWLLWSVQLAMLLRRLLLLYFVPETLWWCRQWRHCDDVVNDLVTHSCLMAVDDNRYCRMTNYELLRWLVETRSRDVGHNRTLHSWASDRETFSDSIAMLHITFYHSVTHVARLFPVLAGLSSPARTSFNMIDRRYIHYSRYFYWIQVFKSLLIISLLFYSGKII